MSKTSDAVDAGGAAGRAADVVSSGGNLVQVGGAGDATGGERLGGDSGVAAGRDDRTERGGGGDEVAAVDQADVMRVGALSEARASRSMTRKRRAEADHQRRERLFDSSQSDDQTPDASATASNKSEDSEDEAAEDDAMDDDEESGEDVPTQVSPESGPYIVPVLDSAVRVKPPESIHESWEAWFDYLRGYETETMQQIRVQEALKCALRNKRLRGTAGALKGNVVPVVPEEWDYYKRTFICTHAWKPKTRNTSKAGTKSRPRRRIKYTGCPFRFNVQLVERGGRWCLQVLHGLFEHNHAINCDTFATYPSQRGVRNPETASRVQDLIATRTKRSEIYDYLIKRGENIIQRDLDNLISRHRSRVTTGDDDDAAARVVAAFVAEAEGNVASVDETQAGETGVISLTTRHMRALYARFPELLLIDCTHKTNRYGFVVQVNLCRIHV